MSGNPTYHELATAKRHPQLETLFGVSPRSRWMLRMGLSIWVD
jgi:hypothetical protein